MSRLNSMRITLGLFVLSISLSGIIGQDYCSPFSSVIETAPPPPDLPDVFETRIEVNSVYDGITINLRKYFDGRGRRSAVVLQDKNVETRLIYDYDTNEINILTFSINNTLYPALSDQPLDFTDIQCVTVSLTDTPLFNTFYGYIKVNDTYINPDTVYNALLFRTFPQAYNGTEWVRGIPCDAYISCLYLNVTQSSFTSRYFFSRFNYSMPQLNDQFARVPVRAIFQGVRAPNGTKVNFLEYFDYYEFRTNRTNRDILQTPPGVVCENRKPTRPTPNFGKSFRFSEENTNNMATSYIKNLVYNQDLQVIRGEYRNTQKMDETSNSLDLLAIIHDYNIGVSYEINEKQGNCSVTPIRFTSFDSDFDYTQNLFNSTNDLVVRLKSPESILLLDSVYVYTGRRMVNGINTNVFVSDRSKFNRNKTFITEYTFASDEVIFENNLKMDKNLPVTLSIRVPGATQDDNFYTFSTFYNFELATTNLRWFDVSECYNREDKIDFRIKLPYKNLLDPSSIENLNQLSTDVFKFLFKFTNETFTRFASPQITFSTDGNLYIRSSILPNPPPLTLFTPVPGKWLIGGGIIKTFYNIPTNENCALLCLDYQNCLSFDYSNSTKTCYAMPKHGSEADLRNYSTYTHYSRNTLYGFAYRPTVVLWDFLKNSTNSKTFTLPVNVVSPQPSTVTLTAETIEQIRGDGNRFGTTQNMALFNLVAENKRLATFKGREFLGLSVDSCATACKSELSFECQSFDFCYLSGDCRISSNVINPEVDSFVDDACDVYERDVLFHYYPPTLATLDPNDKVINDVGSASECAMKCDKDVTIHCRSFNYCQGTKICYLSERHLININDRPDPNANFVCGHYIRNFLSDFSYTSTSTISVSAEIVYYDANLEACSAFCVNADGFNCKSFDFCPESKACLLNSGVKRNASFESPLVKKDSCANYKREYIYSTSAYINAKPKKTNDKSEGTLVALSIVFSVVGLAIGAIGGIFIIKKRS